MTGRGVSGTVGRGSVHHVLNDFAMKLTTLVKAGAHTGYVCDVKRENDKDTRYAVTKGSDQLLLGPAW